MDERIVPKADKLKAFIDYNGETGVFHWKVREVCWFSSRRSCSTWNARYAGKEALTSTNHDGYRVGAFFGEIIRAHRAAWAIWHGDWPSELIDHINGDRSDNRIANLREANFSQNRVNTTHVRKSKSGVTGVVWCKQKSKWQAQVKFAGERLHLGFFVSIQDAKAAYEKGAERLHGEFLGGREI